MNKGLIVLIIGAVGIGLAIVLWPKTAAAGTVAQPGVNTGTGGAAGAPGTVNNTAPAAFAVSAAASTTSLFSSIAKLFSPAPTTPAPAGANTAPINASGYQGFIGPLPVSAVDANGIDIGIADNSIAGNNIDLSSLNLGGSLDTGPMLPGTVANYPDTSIAGVDDPTYSSSFDD